VNLEKKSPRSRNPWKKSHSKAPLQVFATNPPSEKVAMATLVTSMLFEHPSIRQNTSDTHMVKVRNIPRFIIQLSYHVMLAPTVVGF